RVFFSVVAVSIQKNSQFPDRGSQYRGVVFYANADQKRVAEAYIAQLNAARAFPKRLSTQVVPLKAFYTAEGYHQDYLHLHPDSPYIATYDLPKVRALKSLFPSYYQPDPVLVRRT